MADEETVTEQPKSEWKSGLIGGIAGALGATLVGLVFSTTTFTFFANLLGHNVLPHDVVVFVSGGDCGQGWKKFDRAEGRFLVGAGSNRDHSDKVFQAGFTNVGSTTLKLEENNLPKTEVKVPFTFVRAKITGLGDSNDIPLVMGLGKMPGNNAFVTQDFALSLGGQSTPVDILPPSVALTACEKIN